MVQQINPPQFDKEDSEDIRLYKHRQFVEDVIRSFNQLSDEINQGGGIGGGSGSGGYPAQLGYMGVR